MPVAKGSESPKWYFLNKKTPSLEVGGVEPVNEAVRDADGVAVIEQLPEGATEEEFAPRQLEPVVRLFLQSRIPSC